MNRFLNLEIMGNPLNWATVFLMCLIALTALCLIAPEAGDSQA